MADNPIQDSRELSHSHSINSKKKPGKTQSRTDGLYKPNTPASITSLTASFLLYLLCRTPL